MDYPEDSNISKTPASRIIECVPNFSEGRDEKIICKIKQSIEGVEGVKVLHVDIGYDVNRTVITFAGEPQAIIDAAFQAAKIASGLIDMTKHKGIHPRIGTTDVIPLIPIKNVSMNEAIDLSYQLAQRIGNELNIPVYCYENSALIPGRKNLENIRKGGYEGLQSKITDSKWKPDFGPSVFNKKTGATIIGARKILIAYNVNINTDSIEIANEIASCVRESGKKITDEKGNKKQVMGLLKSVKAIGWYIKEYNKTQVSMNLTDIDQTPVYKAFETVKEIARQFHVGVSGSEIIGLVPLKALLETGLFYKKTIDTKLSLSEDELINLAIEKTGLNNIKPFNPKERIIEYLI